jgi:hypothetical protein
MDSLRLCESNPAIAKGNDFPIFCHGVQELLRPVVANGVTLSPTGNGVSHCQDPGELGLQFWPVM